MNPTEMEWRLRFAHAKIAAVRFVLDDDDPENLPERIRAALSQPYQVLREHWVGDLPDDIDQAIAAGPY